MIIDKIIFASAKNMPQQVLQNKEDIAKLLSELKDIYNIQQDLTTTTTSVALADTDIPSGVTGGFLLSRNGYFYKIVAINSGVVYLTYYAEFEGATGNGIASISLLSTAGLVDTYRILFTDGTHFDYNVTNGQDGTDGADGADGATGNGIASVSLLSTAGLVDTYRITFTDGTHFDYNVTNGQDGATGATGNGIASISLLSTAGLVDTYRILFTDGTHFDYNVTNGQDGATGATGNGIASVSLLSTVGLVDTYRILFTDGTHFDFSVTNGIDGAGTEIYVNGIAVSSVSFNSDPQTQINNKVDKVSMAARVYATDLGGNQTTLEYSANADANKLVQRYSGGQILVPNTPTSSNHAASKDYVDNGLNGKQSTLTFDNTPTDASNNPVTSGGVYTALTDKVDKTQPAITGNGTFNGNDRVITTYISNSGKTWYRIWASGWKECGMFLSGTWGDHEVALPISFTGTRTYTINVTYQTNNSSALSAVHSGITNTISNNTIHTWYAGENDFVKYLYACGY